MLIRIRSKLLPIGQIRIYVKPLPRENDFFHKHDLEDKFVVLFAGNHGYIAALDKIIVAAEILTGYP